jgi:acyl-CoA synthetase (NDP forming)/ribosomal protein S18 acetylase RimI-like enzyme
MPTRGRAATPRRGSAARDPNATYPAHREADVVLRDGSTVHVRPVRPSDVDAIRSFLAGLSLRSRAFRFFSAGANLDRAATQAVDVDHVRRFGLVALQGDRVVGHATYVGLDATHAEAAFAVADDLQGRGLGTILLAHLAEAAHAAGFEVFVNEVLPENHRMVGVFRESGFPTEIRSKPGYLQIDVPTAFSDEALDRFWAREQIAAAAALTAVLRPASVAVIVGRGTRGGLGADVLRNLAGGGFGGAIHTVGEAVPAVGEVAQAYGAERVTPVPTIHDLPDGVDLAVVDALPDDVLEAAEACAERGVRALAVLSGGFSESGEEGMRRERELLTRCREHGVRLLGPDCSGVVNTDPHVRLNVTPAPSMPIPGRIGLLAQSGTVGLAVLERASARGIGISSFVSLGNKADLSGNDVIQYWEQDPATDAILVSLRSFGNPRNFGRIARRVGPSKPIVAVTAPRPVGSAGVSTRTGALVASSDATVDALYRQSGVMRTRTMTELLDVASLLSTQPVPTGDRVAIVAGRIGPAALCVDACRSFGLTLPPPADDLRARLRGLDVRDATGSGPALVLREGAGPDEWRRAVLVAMSREDVDAVIVVVAPPFDPPAAPIADALRRAADEGANGGPEGADGLPVVCVIMAAEDDPNPLGGTGTGSAFPVFAFPEDAARALAHVARYGIWRARPLGAVPRLQDVDEDGAKDLLAAALAAGDAWLAPGDAGRLLSRYGIPVADRRIAGSIRGAGDAAVELGGPVALKAVTPTPFHRSDVGGVRLALSGRTAVERGAREMRAGFAAAGVPLDRFEIQRMVDGGLEMLVGVVHDPIFGPVVAVAAADAALELVGDVAVRLTPLTDRDASEMLRSLATFPLLDGYRGAPKLDVAALEDILLRISAIVEAHPEVVEVDLDPVKILGRSAQVLDARVRIEPPAAQPPLLARRSI